ncbi:unnamed protein product [Orchesella dallaii]|uniref:E3 ubiquitin-protein ligase n=1 Tax=Orchesella dallaii TaxID=48710 RepID=A0ABP1S658_9HEXA
MPRTAASQTVVTLCFRVENISMLRQRAFSQPTFIRGVPWRIMVQPCQVGAVERADQNKSLGFFLQCDGDSESPSWSCKAHVKLRLMPQKPKVKAFSSQFTDRFHSKGNNWGYINFIDWSTLMDPSRGYVKNDNIYVEVDVKVGAPTGLTSQDSKPNEVKISNLTGPGRSKVNVHFRIENISKLQRRVLSKPVYVRNLPWRIMAQPCYDQDGRKLSLGIFLHCDGQADSPNWNCKAEVKMRMLSQKRGLKCIVSQFSDTFAASANDWGYSNVIGWNCLDPSVGYVNRNDFIDLIVDIKAEEPQGLRSQIPGEKASTTESKKLVINLPNDFLTCPICYELPRNEIFQCRNGHVVCDGCINNLTHCPQCRLRFQEKIRNRALECILENLKLECNYKNKGCTMVAQRRQLTEHERTCAFQFVK